MKSNFAETSTGLFSKVSDTIDWILSKLIGFIFLLGGLGFFIGILFVGGKEIYQQVTWSSASAIIESVERNASGSELNLYLTVTEKDGSIRSTSLVYSLSQSMETDEYSTPIFIYPGATVKVIYQRSDPSHLVIAQPIWGFLVALLMAFVFAAIGYFQLSETARTRFNKWNKDWRFWWSLLFLSGLACFIMAVFLDEPTAESVIQSIWVGRLIVVGIGLPLFLIGGYKLISIVKRKNVLNNLIASGIKLELKEFTVEEDKFSFREDPETGKKLQGAFIIKSVFRKAGEEIPYVFTSQPIYFDPTPHLPQMITVHVNPNDNYDYHMDLSFLPANH